MQFVQKSVICLIIQILILRNSWPQNICTQATAIWMVSYYYTHYINYCFHYHTIFFYNQNPTHITNPPEYFGEACCCVFGGSTVVVVNA